MPNLIENNQLAILSVITHMQDNGWSYNHCEMTQKGLSKLNFSSSDDEEHCSVTVEMDGSFSFSIWDKNQLIPGQANELSELLTSDQAWEFLNMTDEEWSMSFNPSPENSIDGRFTR